MADMFDGLIIIPILFIPWGWLVLLGISGLMVVRGVYRWCKGDKRGLPMRIVWIVLLLVIAAGWFRVMLPLTFGQTMGVVATSAGEREASVERHGARTYSIKVNKGRHSFPLLGGCPKEMFWMPDGQSIGLIVKYEDQRRIIEVDRYFNYENPGVPPEERGEPPTFNGFVPVGVELTEFEAARRLARHEGRLLMLD